MHICTNFRVWCYTHSQRIRLTYILVCYHRNKTLALIANLPNSAQLGGTPYHSPNLHLASCSSVGMRQRTDRQTHRCTWPIYISHLLQLMWNVNILLWFHQMWHSLWSLIHTEYSWPEWTAYWGGQDLMWLVAAPVPTPSCWGWWVGMHQSQPYTPVKTATSIHAFTCYIAYNIRMFLGTGIW